MNQADTDRRLAPSRAFSGSIVAATVLTLMAAAVTYRYWPSDEREVRRHLVHLAEVLSVPGAENEAARLTRMAALREYFSDDVRVVAESREIVSRDALLDALSTWTAPPGGFAVEVADQTMTLDGARGTARIALTATILSRDLRTGLELAEGWLVDLTMVHAPGDWVITAVQARPAGEPR